MDKKAEYAEMLEIPVSTSTITYKPAKEKKKRRTEKGEDAKEKLLKKINETLEESPSAEDNTESKEVAEETCSDNIEKAEEFSEVTIGKRKTEQTKTEKKLSGIGVIGAQLAIIAALVAVIVVSNIFWADSGINRLMRTVFSAAENTSQIPGYDEFDIDLSDIGAAIDLQEGVMTYNYSGSVYSPLSGTVSQVTKEADKYAIEIAHNAKFKTVISGIDYAYCSVGDTVYPTVPIGYLTDDKVSICFYGEDGLVTDYEIRENKVVWEV